MIDRYTGKTRIVIPGRRGSDLLILSLTAYVGIILGGLLVLLVVQRPPDRYWAISVVLALGLVWQAWMARGAIDRLRRREDWLTADTEGLKLPSSLTPRSVPWSAIHKVEIQDSHSAGVSASLVVGLRQPVQSLMSPWGAIQLEVGLPNLGVSREAGVLLANQLERLRTGRADQGVS